MLTHNLDNRYPYWYIIGSFEANCDENTMIADKPSTVRMHSTALVLITSQHTS